MKKLILVASLAVAAVMVVPITSASAATGVCTLEGNATLKPPLNAELKETEFSFENETGECVEAPSGAKLKVEEATVEGVGELSCPAGQNIKKLEGEVSGSGKIRLEGEASAKEFEFKLVAAAGLVTFTATGGITAGGEAEFLTHEKAVKQCAQLKAEKLEFTAVAAGTF
jgi:hypothetical protein